MTVAGVETSVCGSCSGEPICSTCHEEGWVCENHPDRPWDAKLPTGCTCGAGEPCPDCNPSNGDKPPRAQPGFKTIFDKDGSRH